MKAWLRDEKVGRGELGGRMDPAYISDLNACKCPPLQAIRAISRTVRLNLPLDDKTTDDVDESMLGSAIWNEANELLRRAQRCRFALRRLDEKRGLNDPEDLASRAALVNEIEGLVDPPERDGKKPASLDAIDVCRGAKDAALAARAELETSSDGVLDEALASLNVSRAGAALAVAA